MTDRTPAAPRPTNWDRLALMCWQLHVHRQYHRAAWCRECDTLAALVRDELPAGDGQVAPPDPSIAWVQRVMASSGDAPPIDTPEHALWERGYLSGWKDAEVEYGPFIPGGDERLRSATARLLAMLERKYGYRSDVMLHDYGPLDGDNIALGVHRPDCSLCATAAALAASPETPQ